MSKIIKIKKGLDINLIGEADKTLTTISSNSYAVKPTDFEGVFPKMLVKTGDEVKSGTPLFYDKYRENIIFTSPVSGKIGEIKRGEKRVLQEIQIAADAEIKYVEFKKADPNSISKEEIIETLLKSGVWPFIKQRPYSIIADPKDEPKAIHISAFDSSPLAQDFDFIVHGKGDIFQAGIDAISKLTKGKVHLNCNSETTKSKVFLNSKNVQVNLFSGPHPAGNVGTQIHHIDPINKGDVVWVLSPQAVLTIGRLFIEGKYDASKVIALTGAEVKNPKYYKLINGCSIESIIKDNINEGKIRIISGNVLTGTKVEMNGYLGFYDSQITVIPEGDEPEFLGWGMPGFGKFSTTRTFLSFLTPNKKYNLDTNYHGCLRAFVVSGEYEKVFPMDIMPVQLLKSIIVNDIEKMENLGIYEVAEEDFALCDFVCTSKIETQSIIRQGLNTMIKELN
ncbi:MAG: Na(+)-translocating NADH-quinone reductase subunit A [Saprospiraceae bacterium]|nr:Na(+)-translocating NADH-quinone reductase subunit A [Saprospiraceae bacterium]